MTHLSIFLQLVLLQLIFSPLLSFILFLRLSPIVYLVISLLLSLISLLLYILLSICLSVIPLPHSLFFLPLFFFFLLLLLCLPLCISLLLSFHISTWAPFFFFVFTFPSFHLSPFIHWTDYLHYLLYTPPLSLHPLPRSSHVSCTASCTSSPCPPCPSCWWSTPWVTCTWCPGAPGRQPSQLLHPGHRRSPSRSKAPCRGGCPNCLETERKEKAGAPWAVCSGWWVRGLWAVCSGWWVGGLDLWRNGVSASVMWWWSMLNYSMTQWFCFVNLRVYVSHNTS